MVIVEGPTINRVQISSVFIFCLHINRSLRSKTILYAYNTMMIDSCPVFMKIYALQTSVELIYGFFSNKKKTANFVNPQLPCILIIIIQK